MSKYGSSYQGNDFLEWWKHHYGVDYDGVSQITKSGSMTDEDVAIGRTLYNTYTQQQYLKGQYDQAVADTNKAYNDLMDTTRNQYDSQIAGAQTEYDTNSKNLLDNYNRNSATAKDIYDRSTAELLENYGTAQSVLDKNKRQSQQNASITLDKLKKYLPTQVKAQGLGGLGVSESTMLQAYNNYNSDMGAIESDYQDRKSDLEANYNTSKNSYDTSYQETQGRLDEAYGSGQANLDNTFAARKGSLEAAKSSAVDTLAQQLTNTLSTLKQNYDKGVFDVARDENGNLLVDNVLKEYAARLSEEQGINYATALEAIRQAVYTTGDEMNAFVEQYRGKVTDEQFNALLQEGVNRANVNAENKRVEEEQRTETNQYNAYVSAENAVVNSGISNQAEMDTFLEQFRGKVSESQWNDLVLKGQSVVTANGKTNTQNSYKNYAQMAADIKADSSFYTHADIDKALGSGALTQEDADALKQLISTTAQGEVQNIVESGDIGLAISEAEKAYSAGKFDQTTYQTIVYNAAAQNLTGADTVSAIQEKEKFLNDLKSSGKITEASYKSLTKYLYASSGKVLAKGNYTTAVDENIFGMELPDGQLIKVTIGGTTYDVSTNISGNFADSSTTDILNKLVGGSPSNRTLAMLNGKMYCYRTLPKGNGWVTVNDYSWGTINGTSKGFKEAYEKAYSNQGGATVAPYGKTQPSSWTYEEVAKVNPGIRTRSEFARGNNADKQKYGTYENYLKAMWEKYS